MKVLHIHSRDFVGGGGGTIAMGRLHAALLRRGVESMILCGRKMRPSPHSVEIPAAPLVRRAERGLRLIGRELGLHDVHVLTSFGVRNLEIVRQADVLHIHGTHGHFNYLAIPLLTGQRPAAFTLHDSWAYTGHCTYTYGCERWREGCGQCPNLDVHPAVKRDNTRLEWKLKRWVYARSNLAIVTLNSRQTKEVRESILGKLPIRCIPNGIDSEVYEPLDRNLCKHVLGIAGERNVIMFASLDLADRRKGGDLLIAALQELPDALKQRSTLLLLGGAGQGLEQRVGIDVCSLGFIENDRLKAIGYSAADVFVHPARADTLPLVIQEAMACATPVVSFDVGGIPDMVRDGQTGYLAKPEDAKDLGEKLEGLLEDAELRTEMGSRCRAFVLSEYAVDRQVDSLLEVYRGLLGGKPA